VAHCDSVTSWVTSRDMVENHVGKSPLSWLRQSVRDSRLVYAVISKGTVPVKRLPESDRDRSVPMDANARGNVPRMALLASDSTVSEGRPVNEVGRDVIALETKDNSLQGTSQGAQWMQVSAAHLRARGETPSPLPFLTLWCYRAPYVLQCSQTDNRGGQAGYAALIHVQRPQLGEAIHDGRQAARDEVTAQSKR
jgi:hypothetical protein